MKESKGMKLIKRVMDLKERGEVNTFTITDEGKKELQGLLGITKINPHGLRVGVIKDWDSKWYADADFADYLVEDYNIRTFLKKKLYAAGVSKIEIERASDRFSPFQDLISWRCSSESEPHE